MTKKYYVFEVIKPSGEKDFYTKISKTKNAILGKQHPDTIVGVKLITNRGITRAKRFYVETFLSKTLSDLEEMFKQCPEPIE